MPEGKKPVAPSPAAPAAAKEDSYSAKTHLHQPMPVTEMATVAATALPANAPEGTLPSEVRPEIVTWDKLVEAIKASGKAYNMAMIEKAYNMANDAHKGVCRRSGEPYICHPLAVARLVLDLGMDSESIAAALLHDVVEIDAGDTYLYDEEGYKSKAEREEKAAQRIFGLLPDDQRDEYYALWREFEDDITYESRFASILDRMQPLLLNYTKGGIAWKEHGVHKEQVLSRNRPYFDTSHELAEVIESVIEDAAAKGWLKA